MCSKGGHATKKPTNISTVQPHSHDEWHHRDTVKGKRGPKKKQERIELRCSLCHYQSKFNGQLMEHFDKKHKDFRGFKCEQCDDFDSADADTLTNPTVRESNKAVNKITAFIRFVMTHKMALERHKREAHGVAKDFQCELCDHVSDSREEVKKHQELCHSDNWWPNSSTSNESSKEPEDENENVILSNPSGMDLSDKSVLDEIESQVTNIDKSNDGTSDCGEGEHTCCQFLDKRARRQNLVLF